MLTLLLTLTTAFGEPISSGATLLTGIGATFDDNPATMNLEFQGELPLSTGDIGVGVVLPLLMTTSGQRSFGFSSQNTMFTFIPSLRLRAMNEGPVRVYGDVGVGVAQITGTQETWMLQSTTSRTGWSARIVGGLEVGQPDGGLTFVFEPIVLHTLQFKESASVGYSGRIGVGVRY